MLFGLFRADPRTNGVKRSPKWPAVRAAHLKQFPTCSACGGSANLEVHHKMPFHLRPELELDPDNLITLCESPSHSCHLIWGHFLRWTLFNPNVVADAANYLRGCNAAHAKG